MLQKFMICSFLLATLYINTSAQTNTLEDINIDSSTSASSPEIEPSSKFVISGSADVYYRYNFHNPKSSFNNFTSFSNSHNSFELGMVSLKVEHSMGKVGMVADLGFGRRADEFSYNDGNSRIIIKQLLISYAPSSKVKLSIGSCATHIGYEMIDAWLNRNYSMSYMFSYGPFFHTCVKGEFKLGEKSTLMIGVSNPSDLKTASAMPKMAIGQLATASKDDKVKAYFNYQGGKYNDSSRLYQGDVVLTYAVTDKFSLGYNGTLQSRNAKISSSKWSSASSWWGSALYINVDPVPTFGLTLRGEYLNDKKNVLGFNGSVIETTLSANFKIDNLTIIPELRLDNGSYAPGLFKESSGAATKTTQGFLLAAVYHF